MLTFDARATQVRSQPAGVLLRLIGFVPVGENWTTIT